MECDEPFSPFGAKSDADSARCSFGFMDSPITLLSRSCAVVPAGLGITRLAGCFEETWAGLIRIGEFEEVGCVTGGGKEGNTFETKL